MSKYGNRTDEVQIRIAIATTSITILSSLLTSSSISFLTKHRLRKSPAVSIILAVRLQYIDTSTDT
ncbi:hypothetical protein DPMN_010724 [Dreissena polymorpha]|uniref:Uncharacterized protein n=1 Tax=Dreissena polymorpha TaxID=45954 RepID=A0A9D4RZI8_DREPO|nr:hypothetical protein DPMN_010724 [Dreissena polymorpha]